MPFVRHWVPLTFSIILLLFTMPAAGAKEAAMAPIVEHGPRGSKMVALTFDACRTALPDEYDEQVIAVLVREQVPATIFMSGKWVERNPEKAGFLAQQPQFEIANHAYWHPHLLQKTDSEVLRDLRRAQDVLIRLAGKRPRYFRPPYGEVDDRVARLAAQCGLVTVQYDIASGDPDPKLKPERIVRSVLDRARGGSIIVFHMNRHGVHTAEMLPQIIAGLRGKGFELATVGRMLEQADAGTGKRGSRKIAKHAVTSITTDEH